MKFDPNKQIKKRQKPVIWGTHIPSRKPQWKTYLQKSHAISALKYRGDYPEDNDPRVEKGNFRWKYKVLAPENTLWTLKDDEWIEVAIKRFYHKDEDIIL